MGVFNQNLDIKGYADLNKNELRNARVQNLAAAPGGAVTGQIYYDTATNRLYFFNGSVWIDTTGGSGGIPATIMDVKGDIIVATAADTAARKAAGANNTFLVADSAQTDGLAWRTVADSDLPATIMRDTEHTLASHQELIATSDLTDWPRTAALDLASQRITSVQDPTAEQDAATKAYVDAQAAGARDVKDSVRAATTAALPANTRTGNILTASANGVLPAQDEMTLAPGESLLVKDEAAGANNGIYTVTSLGAAGAAWVLTRRADADSSAEVTGGLYVWVNEGTAAADSGWLLTTNDPITLNTTALVFAQVSALGQVTAGAGLTKTGSTLDAVGAAAFGTGGPGGGLVVNADSIAVDQSKVARGYTALFGDAAAVSFTITHNLGTTSVQVEVFLVSSGATEFCDVARTTANAVVLSGFAAAPAANAYRAVITSAA